ncbi:enoyl-CoA hydratase-related protein [Pseudalkalibacillus sp. A8]|uniref:enoyl-CoA hydratase-related protein n=1 Tax=Pseudalkalibacillus sp. A8 TaxID=3382641 RepID=UPI0038B6419F
MGYENLDVYVEDNIAFIKINRPEVRNALNKETLDELLEVLDLLEGEEPVKCVVITGEGEKSFAAGADISQLEHKTMH